MFLRGWTGFGNYLRRIRKRRGWTQAETATQVGLTLSAYSKLEQGQREPRWSTVLNLAIAFGVSCDEFGRNDWVDIGITHLIEEDDRDAV